MYYVISYNIAEKLVEEPWDPYYPATPSPIMFTKHSNEEGKFWISMVK